MPSYAKLSHQGKPRIVLLTFAAVIAMQNEAPDVAAMMRQVDPKRLRATIEKLTSWPNRNTNNPTLDEAAAWIAGELGKLPGVKVEIMRYEIKKGQRIAADKQVVQVVATLPGEDDQRVVVGGHFDTINMLERDLAASLAAKAPGANDDGSGTALMMELARIISQRKWKHTLNFVAFSGEEQGLLGSAALAKRAKAEGWKILGVQSNDMVGNVQNKTGRKVSNRVRVFSEDAETHQSREYARWIEYLARTQGPKGFGVSLVLRADRFGRGGDHTPFNREGFTAVRFVETVEEYDHQHTPNDLPEFIDYNFLANVARVDLLAMATLANGAEPPTNVRIDRRQGHDTHLTWASKPGVKYLVYWRETKSTEWQGAFEAGASGELTVKGINKDDHFFAVGAEGGIPVPAG